MKAITTKYLPATSTLPARLIAMDQDGNRVTLKDSQVGDCALSSQTAARIAARALCDKMHWSRHFVTGHVKEGYVHVFVD